MEQNYLGLGLNFKLLLIMKTLYVIGVVTTTSTLLAAIAILVNKPDIQQKLQKEVDTVIGPDQVQKWNRYKLTLFKTVRLN